jgi:hypothetical protein
MSDPARRRSSPAGWTIIMGAVSPDAASSRLTLTSAFAGVLDGAVDPAWKLFTAKAIRRAGATVVPVFFEGQNSRLFQLASHVSLTLRLGLLFNELRNKIGSAVAVRIGAPAPFRSQPPRRSQGIG